MKLWCMFIVFLLVTTSISFVYSIDSNNKSKSNEINHKNLPYNHPSSFMQHDRSMTKRSQRNANILYRYCRQSGQAPQFCLKYAVRMIFATGH